MSASFAELRARIERLERLDTARDHALAYADAVDAADPELIAATFGRDGVLSVPSGDLSGPGPIAEFFRTRVLGVQRRHFITNTRARLRPDGDVDVRSYFLFTSREPERSVLGWGVYRDVVRVDGEATRFVRKTIEPAVGTTLAEGWAL